MMISSAHKKIFKANDVLHSKPMTMITYNFKPFSGLRLANDHGVTLTRPPNYTPSKTKEWGPLKKGARTREETMIVFPTIFLREICQFSVLTLIQHDLKTKTATSQIGAGCGAV